MAKCNQLTDLPFEGLAECQFILDESGWRYWCGCCWYDSEVIWLLWCVCVV